MLCSVNSAPLKCQLSSLTGSWLTSQEGFPTVLPTRASSLGKEEFGSQSTSSGSHNLREGSQALPRHPELTAPMLLTFVHGAQVHPRDFTGVEHTQWKVVCDPGGPWPTKAPPSFTYTSFLCLGAVCARTEAHIHSSGFNPTCAVFTLGLSQTRWRTAPWSRLGHRRQPDGWRNCTADAHQQLHPLLTTSTRARRTALRSLP